MIDMDFILYIVLIILVLLWIILGLICSRVENIQFFDEAKHIARHYGLEYDKNRMCYFKDFINGEKQARCYFDIWHLAIFDDAQIRWLLNDAERLIATPKKDKDVK